MVTNFDSNDGMYVFGDPYLEGTPYGGPKYYNFNVGSNMA